MSLSVTYQGIEASNSFLAAKEFFSLASCPEPVRYVGAERFQEIFTRLSSGQAQLGFPPVENTLAGSVYEILDLLDRYPVRAIAEYRFRVVHNLLGLKATSTLDLSHLRRVYSHPQALAQCSQFFEQASWIEPVQFSDTARAALFVAEKHDPTIAAIAPEAAAKLYGLEVLRPGIEDRSDNLTRFLLLAPTEGPAEQAELLLQQYRARGIKKCLLIFSLPHRPGSLAEILTFLASQAVNLTRIESRPTRERPFEYRFFVDFEFPELQSSADSALVKSVLAGMQERTLHLKLLGLLPAAEQSAGL